MASSSSPTIAVFLQPFRVEKGSDHTHTSFAKPSGAFYLPSGTHAAFMDAYHAALTRGEDLHVTEHHRHIGPMVVDLDFRYEAPMCASIDTHQAHLERKHGASELDAVVAAYCTQVCGLVDAPPEFDVYVTEKSGPTLAKGVVKDGVHLVAPAIVTRPSMQLMMRKAALPGLADALAGLPLLNKIEDVVDEAVIERNNWLMYGSKKPGGEAYKVTRVYRCTAAGEVRLLPETPEDAQTARQLVALFSIRNKYEELRVRPSREGDVAAFEAAREEARRRRQAVQAVMMQPGDSDQPGRVNTCEDPGAVASLVRLLDSKRASNYDSWIRVGWCLRNIDHRLLEAWVDFSRGSPKYVEGECARLWSVMRPGHMGLGTMHMWARQDNPEGYLEQVRTGLQDLLRKSLNGTHHDVALVAHHMYSHQYACASISNKTWYEFREHRWHEIDSAWSLRLHLSAEVFNEYNALALATQQRAMASHDEGEQQELLKLNQRITTLALQLKRTSFKNMVMVECGELFYREKFEDLLDSDLNLIGFENGVYDLERFEFREGRPDDHMSFSTGISYIPWQENHPIARDIVKFWEQVHPEKALREYVLRSLASCVSGAVREERFNIWTGLGSNGKSLCVSLMEKTLGKYCCKFPVTLLTQKRAASGAATPEIAQAKGKRFACLVEPSQNEQLYVGTLKELSGSDTLQTRQLFKSPVEWRPQFKLFLLCNDLPSVPSDDGGTWRRIRVVEFGSRFTEKPDPQLPNEFNVDLTLGERLPSWAPHFAALLIEIHGSMRRCLPCNRPPEPEAVTKCTRDYQRTNDNLADFLDTCIERDPARVGEWSLTIGDAFNELREWIREDAVPIKLPKKSEIKAFLDRTLLPKRGAGSTGRPGIYPGCRLRNRNGDDEDEDEL